MSLSAAGLIVVVCGVCITACTPSPKSFTPRTPEEQAVVRTLVAFLAAWHARDAERLKSLVLPEATMEALTDGSRVPPERILALPQRVSVGAYVHAIVEVSRGSDQVTTRIRWDLVRENGGWRIQHLTQTTWVHPWDIPGGGA
jgi:hypothetical protein